MKTLYDSIWEFIRGDLPISDFEELAYHDESLEKYLGHELYIEVISNDFGNIELTDKIKEKLSKHLRSRYARRCKCIELRNSDVIDMGGQSEKVFSTLRQIVERGEPYWWLYISQCEECNQFWLVAQEERQNDVFCMRRLDETDAQRVITDGVWPAYFDKYEFLLLMGKYYGKSVSFIDPINSSSLSYSMEQLAKENPGIELSYLAELLNLDIETALTIGKKIVIEKGIDINLEK